MVEQKKIYTGGYSRQKILDKNLDNLLDLRNFSEFLKSWNCHTFLLSGPIFLWNVIDLQET